MSKIKYILFILFAWMLTCSVYAQDGDLVSMQKYKNLQDSCVSLVKKTSEQSQQIRRLKNSVEKLQSSNVVEEGKVSVNVYYLLGGVLAIVILFLLLILCLIKIVRKNKTIQKKKGELEAANSQVSHYKNLVDGKDRELSNLRLNSSSTKSQPQVSSQQQVAVSPKPPRQPAKPQPPKPKKVKKYFGDCVKGYFMKVYDTKGDLTGFEVTFDTPAMESGTFELIDIYKVKSSDSVSTVMDITGSKTKIEEATSARVVSPGKVKKEGDYWKVVSKVKVILS